MSQHKPVLAIAKEMIEEFAAENAKADREYLTLEQNHAIAEIYNHKDYSDIPNADKDILDEVYFEHLEANTGELEVERLKAENAAALLAQIDADRLKESQNHAMALIGASLDYNDPDDEEDHDEDFVIEIMLVDLMLYCTAVGIDFDTIYADATLRYNKELVGDYS